MYLWDEVFCEAQSNIRRPKSTNMYKLILGLQADSIKSNFDHFDCDICWSKLEGIIGQGEQEPQANERWPYY